MPVKALYISGLSGMYAIRFLQSIGFSFIDMPSIKISPSLKSFIPTIDFIVVVLPAPLCPIKANMSPFSTEMFMFFAPTFPLG